LNFLDRIGERSQAKGGGSNTDQGGEGKRAAVIPLEAGTKKSRDNQRPLSSPIDEGGGIRGELRVPRKAREKKRTRTLYVAD